MAIIKDEVKVFELMERVYNGKMVQENKEENIMGDSEAIRSLCGRIFGDGSVTPDPSALHSFNNIVTKLADKVAQPDIEQMLRHFANYTTYPAGTLAVEYRKDPEIGIKYKWTSLGSQPILKRAEAGEIETMKFSQIQTGITYQPLTNSKDCVENFRRLVNDLAGSKVRLIYEQIMGLLKAAATNSEIPQSQVLDKNNSTMQDLIKVANIVRRRGGSGSGKPLFLADQSLISYYANLIETSSTSIMSDSIKDAVYGLELTDLRACTALPLVNEYVDGATEKTQFPVNRGYIIPQGPKAKKVFEVATCGSMVQHTEQNPIDGWIKMVVRVSLAIDLVYGQFVGFVEEDSITEA